MFGFENDVMGRRRVVMRILPGLVLAGGLAACAGGAKKESTGEYIDDAAITTKVKAKILQDEKLKVLQINVETFKGVVQLSGFVDTVAHIQRAVAVAETVEGVVRVENKLSVK